MTEESAKTPDDDRRTAVEDDRGAGTKGAGQGGVDPGREDAADSGQAQGELDRVREDYQALREQHLRLAADFENYRRRSEVDQRQSWTRAQAELVRSLLDALDDLQRVSDLDPDATSVSAVLEGVEMVERKLLQALTDAGAEVIDPEGEVFDPNTMEAMLRVPAEDPDRDDEVAEVFQKGYAFKGNLVRPARVSVLKHE